MPRARHAHKHKPAQLLRNFHPARPHHRLVARGARKKIGLHHRADLTRAARIHLRAPAVLQRPARLLRRVHDVLPPHRSLHQITHHAQRHRFLERDEFLHAGNHNQRARRVRLAHRVHQLQPAHARNANVRHHNIRPVLLKQRPRLISVARLRHHAQAEAVPRNRRHQPHAHQQLVLHDHYRVHTRSPQVNLHPASITFQFILSCATGAVNAVDKGWRMPLCRRFAAAFSPVDFARLSFYNSKKSFRRFIP